MAIKFFPFTIELPEKLVPNFRKLDDGRWFEADLVVTSPSAGVIKVYDIRDAFRGGRGEHLRDVPITGIESALVEVIKWRARELAADQIEDEERRLYVERRSRVESRIIADMVAEQATGKA